MRRISISTILPKRFIPARKGHPSSDLSAQLLQAAHGDAASALTKLESMPAGLTQEEAEKRLAEYGPNALAKDEGHGRLVLLGKALVNPLVILLALLATVSLRDGRRTRGDRDGADGRPRASPSLRAGGAGGLGRQEAPGDDQRDRDRRPRRHGAARCRWPSSCPATS